MQAADGTGAPEPLLPADTAAHFAGSVSRDNVLAYTQAVSSTNTDIWVLPRVLLNWAPVLTPR